MIGSGLGRHLHVGWDLAVIVTPSRKAPVPCAIVADQHSDLGVTVDALALAVARL